MEKDEVYLGRWRKRIKNRRKLDESKITDVLVFYNPKISYKESIVIIRPKNNNYRNFRVVDDCFVKEEPQPLPRMAGVGIQKDFFFKINSYTNLNELSKNIGINKNQLESIFSTCGLEH